MSERSSERTALILLSATAVLLLAGQLLTWSSEDGVFSAFVFVLLLLWAGVIAVRVVRFVRRDRRPEDLGPDGPV
ncbi:MULTISPECIES: hypothetical protein [Kocuria]|uniref:hypothetical protein n=1 Tax=Kocuria TaxID=57493 RepID=UPI0010A38533|nr:hypothetical protein [Kocuria rosea]MCM3485913.1 hypothetical protein [Kocuria rosea]MEB2528111.1 hypothetical protein [Kocuria rosea]MEB2617669.1 hypothetical protein [Kocuria rosea]THE16757.1 hypothetical protein E1J17_14945 [Kocuria rosea]WJZ65795.1 hypothetical protein QR564_13720 [Kocuria rosea]